MTRLTLALLVPREMPDGDVAALLTALSPLLEARGGSVNVSHWNEATLTLEPHEAEGCTGSRSSWRGPETQP